MKCPMCGNEVHPGEAYCGQCGTPVVPSVPSTNQTEMMSAPPSPGGLDRSYVAYPSQSSSAPQSGSAGTQGIPPASSPSAYNVPANLQVPGTRPFPAKTRPVSPQTGSWGPQPGPQADFYQDATEAFSALPGNVPPGYVPHQQPTFPATPPSNQYLPTGAAPTQYGGQTGQYGLSGQVGPQTPSFQPSYPSRPTPQSPQRQSGNTALLIITILLALALIAIVGLGTLYFVRQHAQQTTAQNAAEATATASANTANAAGTAVADATSTATTAFTPTPAATATTAPTPTIVPTATPDANFTFCGQPCLSNGYQTEYPTGWNLAGSSAGLSIQISNPAQSDIFVVFRTPSASANSATDVVSNDLQTNYASKTDYTLSPQSSTVVISGETWVQSTATFQGVTQGSTQLERIEVYGTIHVGKSFIIELQAPDAQFDQTNSQYFVNITGRYLFQP